MWQHKKNRCFPGSKFTDCIEMCRTDHPKFFTKNHLFGRSGLHARFWSGCSGSASSAKRVEWMSLLLSKVHALKTASAWQKEPLAMSGFLFFRRRRRTTHMAVLVWVYLYRWTEQLSSKLMKHSHRGHLAKAQYLAAISVHVELWQQHFLPTLVGCDAWAWDMYALQLPN